MGYLSDASSSVSDLQKFVIAVQYNVPQAAVDAMIAPGLLEFGDPANVSGITTQLDGSISLALLGREDSYIYTQAGESSDPTTIQVQRSTPALTPVADVWRQLIVSGDFSGETTYTYTPPSTYTLASNDFRLWIAVDDIDYSPTFGGGPAGATGFTLESVTGGLTDGGQVFPAFAFALSGFELSLPCLAGNADPFYNSRIRMRNFMLWNGVGLNTSNVDNRRLFIKADGSAQRPDVAIAALGLPAYDNSGNAATFVNNTGSAGSQAAVGTIRNYPPPP